MVAVPEIYWRISIMCAWCVCVRLFLAANIRNDLSKKKNQRKKRIRLHALLGLRGRVKEKKRKE